MKKPADSKENLEKCLCKDCEMYKQRKCVEFDSENGLLYCARTISECKIGSGICLCPGCEVYKENGLAGAVFCLKEIQEKNQNI